MDTKEKILLAHGGGGMLSQALIEEVLLPPLQNEVLTEMDDAACLSVPPADHRMALTTDSYVVQPLFFPGGDIGRLAVCGTVNDLAMVGAQPRELTCGLILEEGFSLADLRTIAASMAAAAAEAGVRIVAGDTKVVPRGSADGVFINTAGVGYIPPKRRVGVDRIAPGDHILINGTLGDHGTVVMAARENLGLETDLKSDVAPLTTLVEMLFEAGIEVHALRDPTRGGLAQALGEMAERAALRFVVEERALPVAPAVTTICDLLGLDVLQVANEGKLLAFVAQDDGERARELLASHPLGAAAALIGRVAESRSRTGSDRGRVELHTAAGGSRIVDRPAGELLPRIC